MTGNASGEGGAPLAPFSSFSVIFSLPLLSSPSPCFSFFFPHLILPFSFLPYKLLPSPSLLLLFSISFLSFSFFYSFLSFSFLFASFFCSFLSFSFLFFFLFSSWSLFFFFFEGTDCTEYLGDVRDDSFDCN